MTKFKQRTLDTIYFTKEGYERVKKEYDELIEKRKSAVDKVKTAREMGDLSENAAYHAARQNLSQIDARLRYLKMQLIYGQVQKYTATDIVGLGCTVVLQANNETHTYTIVGAFEADPANTKISTASPIGQAVMGKQLGDTVIVTTPNGNRTYKIVQITPP